MRKAFVPALSALCLFLTGLLIINWQLWHMAALTSADMARASARKIDAILTEAVSAAKTA